MKGTPAHERTTVATARKTTRPAATNAKGNDQVSRSVLAGVKDTGRRGNTKTRQEGKPGNGAADTGAQRKSRVIKDAGKAKTALPKRTSEGSHAPRWHWPKEHELVEAGALLVLAGLVAIYNRPLAGGLVLGYLIAFARCMSGGKQ